MILKFSFSVIVVTENEQFLILTFLFSWNSIGRTTSQLKFPDILLTIMSVIISVLDVSNCAPPIKKHCCILCLDKWAIISSTELVKGTFPSPSFLDITYM